MHNGGNGGQKVLVLYKVANSIGDKDQYNAFEMPRTGGVTLSTVKTHCHALENINKAGPAGYQWRVRVDDKAVKGTPTSKPLQKYSWWDIQNDSVPLPVREVSFTELSNILSPPRQKVNTPEPEDSVTKAASGAIRSLGKAMNKVAATVEGNVSTHALDDNFPRVSILVFKLLNLVKIHDSFSKPSRQRFSRPQEKKRNVNTSSKNTTSKNNVTTSTPRPNVASTTTHQENLLNLNGPTVHASNNHTTPYIKVPKPPKPAPPRTRIEIIQSEYKKPKDLIWDKIDQRYVAADSINGETGTANNRKTSSVANNSTPKVKGISIDASNAVGKSDHVASGIRTRVTNMETAQKKALKEIRDRELEKKRGVAEEDQFRLKLEPMIKAWSEEHGKKKQLSALLANLHTVLWPGSGWTQVNLGELLDEKNCRRCFFKASRLVHPDKAIKLDAEKRFLAKRIFDGLKQAKSSGDT